LDAALTLMARDGFEGMSLQALADQVHLHKATLFHHFENKADLARAVFDEVFADLLRIIEPLEAGQVYHLDQGIAVLERLADYLADNPAVARFLAHDVFSPGGPFVVDAQDPADPVVRFFTIGWKWLAAARRAGIIRDVDVRYAIFLLLGIVLFYPATAPSLVGLSVVDPLSEPARRAWKRELTSAIRRILAPDAPT
jgi:AcrR family transcriptional regulator